MFELQFFCVSGLFTQNSSLPCCLNDHCIQSRITKIKLQLFFLIQEIFSWFATFSKKNLTEQFYFDFFECALKDKRQKEGKITVCQLLWKILCCFFYILLWILKYFPIYPYISIYQYFSAPPSDDWLAAFFTFLKYSK